MFTPLTCLLWLGLLRVRTTELRDLLRLGDTPEASVTLLHELAQAKGVLSSPHDKSAREGAVEMVAAGDSDSGSDNEEGDGGGAMGAAASAAGGMGDAEFAALDARVHLKRIATWLRAQLPTQAVMGSEELVFSRTGEFTEFTEDNTVSVDGFLYDDGDVERLTASGQLPSHHCTSCGSRKVVPLNFVSHSLSIPELEFVFLHSPLATLVDPHVATLVDVGSRLGAVLFGAAHFAGFQRCIGVEINSELCEVQRAAIAALCAGCDTRFEVVCDDIMNQPHTLAAADALVLHNAFQFFSSPERSATIWRFVARHTKPGCVIVSSPSLQEQLECCGGAAVLDATEWVKQLPVHYPMAEDSDDENADDDGRLFTDICVYTVREGYSDGLEVVDSGAVVAEVGTSD